MNHRFLSLGAGVQSSTLALMAAAGDVEAPQAAIFADTGAEPQAVYTWLDRLENLLPFPIYRVSGGNLAHDIVHARGRRFASIPSFVASERGGMGRRQCTNEYKLRPIQRKVRELMGLARGQRAKEPATMLIGISLDEAIRMKASRVRYIRNEYPLVDRRIDRQACIAWLKAYGHPEPPKSACTFCPYHSDAMWRDMKQNDPVSFHQAVLVDGALRYAQPKMRRAQYVHRSMQPLHLVDFRNAADHGQQDFFGAECEGMCGV